MSTRRVKRQTIEQKAFQLALFLCIFNLKNHKSQCVIESFESIKSSSSIYYDTTNDNERPKVENGIERKTNEGGDKGEGTFATAL
jgi:hypothetical protein